MSERYKVSNTTDIYLVTNTIIHWIDLFSRESYKQIVIDSLKYCQANKGLIIYSWVIMSNHMHMVISTKQDPINNIIRDFKKYCAKEIVKTIRNNNDESRKEWLLKGFASKTENLKRVKKFKVWKDGFHPIEIKRNNFDLLAQKINYIHENPVRAGIVWKAEDYKYSSAIDYLGERGLLNVEIIR